MLFIHSSVNEYLNGLHLLAIMNDAAVNICVQGFVLTFVFIPLGYILGNGIAGLHANSMFHHLRNCQIVF